MAMVDYGSVVKKNGKIIQTEMFMKMKEAVGFKIESVQYRNTSKKRIEGNYFSYIGDKELLVCIYKCGLTFISNEKIIKIINGLEENLDLPFQPMVCNFEINGVKFYIKRLNEKSNRYKLRFEYKNDLYEVLYGYGVDINKNIWYGVESKERRYIDKWFSKK